MFNNIPFWTKSNADPVREMRYAGSWYEGNAEKLKAEIESFLDKAIPIPDSSSCARINAVSRKIDRPILAIVSPHAGYVYSGQTAAFAYRAAMESRSEKLGNEVRRVFVLGPSHHMAVRGVVLPHCDSFATPFGKMEIDAELIGELKTYPLFSINAEAHRIEHSLELQIPFIKHCFPKASLVPLIIGHLEDEGEARMIAEILKGFVSKHDLVVVSSDFTHYGPRYEYTPFGANQPEKIAKLDGEAFENISALDLEGFRNFLDRTHDTICGMYPCQVLLAMLPISAAGCAVNYANSRDITPDEKENSVSYLAIAFPGNLWSENPSIVREASEIIKLSEQEKSTLLTLARKTIEVFVKEKRMSTPAEFNLVITESMKECFGVFVTLTEKPEGEDAESHGDLRGCIGGIYPIKPLWKAVQENAIAAASRDPRFSPVIETELDGLNIDINILTPPRRVASYNDIVIGRDGIILSKNRQQAVFLPQVAVEWNWTLAETLSQLAQKAGLDRDDWRDACKFDVFQSLEIR